MGLFKRASVVAIGATVGVVMSAGPVLAHECTNASKKYADSGAQLVLGANDVVWVVTVTSDDAALQQELAESITDTLVLSDG